MSKIAFAIIILLLTFTKVTAQEETNQKQTLANEHDKLLYFIGGITGGFTKISPFKPGSYIFHKATNMGLSAGAEFIVPPCDSCTYYPLASIMFRFKSSLMFYQYKFDDNLYSEKTNYKLDNITLFAQYTIATSLLWIKDFQVFIGATIVDPKVFNHSFSTKTGNFNRESLDKKNDLETDLSKGINGLIRIKDKLEVDFSHFTAPLVREKIFGSYLFPRNNYLTISYIF